MLPLLLLLWEARGAGPGGRAAARGGEGSPSPRPPTLVGAVAFAQKRHLGVESADVQHAAHHGTPLQREAHPRLAPVLPAAAAAAAAAAAVSACPVGLSSPPGPVVAQRKLKPARAFIDADATKGESAVSLSPDDNTKLDTSLTPTWSWSSSEDTISTPLARWGKQARP